jgi:hypothetical protein
MLHSLAAGLVLWLLPGARPSVQVASGIDAAAAIQAAVDACPASGCRIELPDSIYVLKSQVWVRGKDGVEVAGTFARGRTTLIWDSSLVRKMANPLTGTNLSLTVAAVFALPPPAGGGRDVLPAGWLMWPFIGVSDASGATAGPLGSAKDTSSPWSTSGYQRNGMFLVENSSDASFEHLILDGIRPAYFVNQTIWNKMYDILFGTVGVNFFHSLRGTVSDCEVRNFWSAFYLNDRNLACLSVVGSSDAIVDSSGKMTACGTMGSHLVERSEIHGNWWVAYSENAGDLGSIFRANLAWNDRNQKDAHPGDASYDFGTSISAVSGETGGGFLFEKDVVYPAHVMDHNTVRGVNYPSAWSGYRAAGHAVWADNLLDTVPYAYSADSWQQFLRTTSGKLGHLRRNTFLQSRFDSSSVSSTDILDSLFPYRMKRDSDTVSGKVDTTWLTTTSSIWANIVQPFRIYGHMAPQFNWVATMGDTMRFQALDAKGAIHWEKSWNTNAYDSVGWLSPPTSARVGTVDLDATWWRNQYCLRCRFADGPGATALLPDFGNPVTERATRSSVGVRGAFGRDSVVGSFQPVSARAGGNAWRDTSAGRLHLPLRLDQRLRNVNRWIVLDGQKTALKINELAGGTLTAETMTSFGTSDLVSSDGSEVVLPSPSTDSLIQVDLWLAGLSGSDTLPAGAVSWVWSRGMKPPTTTSLFSARSRRSPVVLGHDSRGVWALVPGTGDGFRLRSPEGRAAQSVREPAGESTRLRFPRVRSGVWILTGPGVAMRMLGAP